MKTLMTALLALTLTTNVYALSWVGEQNDAQDRCEVANTNALFGPLPNCNFTLGGMLYDDTLRLRNIIYDGKTYDSVTMKLVEGKFVVTSSYTRD